jgi:hypothetical protein
MSQKDDLIDRVKEAGLEDLEAVFADVRIYCAGAKNRGKLEQFLPYIHKSVKAQLNEEKLAALVKQEAATCDDDFIKKLRNSPDWQRQLALEILDDQFKKVHIIGRDDYYCKVIDLERKVLARLSKAGAESAMEDRVARYMTQNHQTIPTALVVELRKQFIRHAVPIPKPLAMARHDQDAWSFHKPNIRIENRPTPTWERILSRMSDPEAFAAWIWGVYSGLYQGRRVLWIHGPTGEDGKSMIARVIAEELFGSAASAINNAMLGGNEKRFVTSFFEESSLVIYPDANNTQVLRSELFKTLASAGSDPVSIERKGEQAYTAILSARLWVSSNYPPVITDENFVISRVQYIFIKPHYEDPDPTIKERLKEEMPGFLFYAKDCWGKLNINAYDIKINEKTQVSMNALVESSSEEFEQIFANLFEQSVSSDDIITGKEMKILLEAEGLRSSRDQGNFHGWLVRTKGVQKIVVHPKNTFVYTNLVTAGHGKRTAPAAGKLDFATV